MAILIKREQVDSIIKYIETLTKYPKMATGKDDDIELANTFIGSSRCALLAVFDLPIHWLHAYEDALIKRGHKHTPHIIQRLQEKGYDASQIVKELGFIEVEMWQIIRDNLKD